MQRDFVPCIVSVTTVPHCQTLQVSLLDIFSEITGNHWLFKIQSHSVHIQDPVKYKFVVPPLMTSELPKWHWKQWEFCQFLIVFRVVMLEATELKLLEYSWFLASLEAWKVLSALGFLHARMSFLQLSFLEKPPSLCHPVCLGWILCLSPALLLFFFFSVYILFLPFQTYI